MSNKIALLIPGKRYKITLDDCCIQGELVGTFLKYDADQDRAFFYFGYIGPDWGAWTVKELKDD